MKTDGAYTRAAFFERANLPSRSDQAWRLVRFNPETGPVAASHRTTRAQKRKFYAIGANATLPIQTR